MGFGPPRYRSGHPVRVVAIAGTILLMPLARVEDVMRVVVIVDAVVHGWGLVPHFLLH
jgi:hypothetical protein